jgi:serine/threonine protein kinase
MIAIAGIVCLGVLFVTLRRCCCNGAPNDDNDALADDERFGQYLLKGKIAHGGQGTVYLMERRHDKQEFALKFIVCHDNKDRLAALQEFEMMQSCKGHSNMIELVDMFMNWEEDDEQVKKAEQPPLQTSVQRNSTELGMLNDPNLPLLQSQADDSAALASLTHAPRFVAIVTEYYPAGSLQKYIVSRTQPLSESLIWSSIFQIANLLHFLHSRSPPVLHQDIKPENVLIDLKLNRLVVTDFGLATRLTPNFKGKCNGTRFFMSPEANTGNPTEKTDIWALGCLLYVLCNRNAAVEKGEKCFFIDVRNEEFEDEIVHEIEELGYSYALADLCMNMLKLKVDERLSAEEVVMWCQRECSDLDKVKF